LVSHTVAPDTDIDAPESRDGNAGIGRIAAAGKNNACLLFLQGSTTIVSTKCIGLQEQRTRSLKRARLIRRTIVQPAPSCSDATKRHVINRSGRMRAPRSGRGASRAIGVFVKPSLLGCAASGERQDARFEAPAVSS
jgi:hypothetical protein